MPKRVSAQPEGATLAQEFTDGRQTATLLVRPDKASAGAPLVAVRPGRRPTLLQAVAGAFLPEGYPSSVAGDYLPYQFWDSLQGLSSYVRGMLAGQALLAGVGVGSAAATPLAAAFQFFVKDCMGMLGGILFASSQGSGLDAHAKQWRLAADVANDVGLALELASPHFPRAFLLLACLGSLSRAVTGVAGGATRMALTQHFARRGNAADIAAKEGSQETAVTLAGMALGMALLRAAAGLQPLLWAAFAALTALHVWANVRAMRCLRIASLNQARCGLLLRHYLCQGEALSQEQVAAQESLVPPPLQPLLRWAGLGRSQVPLAAVAPRLGSLEPRIQRIAAAKVQAAAAGEAAQRGRPGSSGLRYIAAAAPEGGRRGSVAAVVLLRQGAEAADVLEAYCAALMLAWAERLHARPGETTGWTAAARAALSDPEAWLALPSLRPGPPGPKPGGSYSGFLEALVAAGWTVERVALLQGAARLSWGADLHSE